MTNKTIEQFMDERNPPQDAGVFSFNAPLKFADHGGDNDQRKVEGVGYSGAVLDHWYWGAVVFDLASTKLSDSVPLLINHDPDQRAGSGRIFVDDNALKLTGSLLSNDHGASVASDSDEGFPWQMSVYIEPGVVTEISKNSSLTINGVNVDGPTTVFSNNSIREVSFCPCGVDANTSANVMSRGLLNGSDKLSNFTRGGDMPDDKTFSRADIAAAEDVGLKLGAEQERDRIKLIMGSDNAKGREKQALAMSLDTDLTPAQAVKLLLSSPQDEPTETSINQFADYMKKIGNIDLGADADNTDQPDEKSIAASWGAAYKGVAS